MNLKTLLFGGAGLFLAMTATMMLMSADVARMRAEEAAKLAERCAARTQLQAQAPIDAAPVGEFATQQADPADDECADVAPPAGTPATQQLDANGAPIDGAVATVDQFATQPAPVPAPAPAPTDSFPEGGPGVGLPADAMVQPAPTAGF